MPLADHGERAPLIADQAGATRQDSVDNSRNDYGTTAQNGDLPHQDADDGVAAQNGTEQPTKDVEGMPEVRKRMKYIFPAIGVGIFLGAADQTIIVSSSGKIGSDFEALNLVSWIATGYFLSITCFQPLFGKLTDLFGRKNCILFGYIMFGLCSVLCGLAQSMPQLVAARAMQGIGGAAMTTGVVVLFSDIVPLRERGTWQGYINLIFATGGAAGAPLGGALADSIGWRWSFLAQGPLCLVSFTAVYFALNLPKKELPSAAELVRRIDFVGAAVLIAAIITLLVGLDYGSNKGWREALPIACVSIAIPLFVAFFFVEAKIANEPFAPVRVIFPRSMFATYLCNFFGAGSYIALIFYFTLYMQAVDGLTASQSGLRLIPSVLVSTSGSLIGGKYIQKTARFRNIIVTAFLLQFVGCLGLFLMTGPLIRNTAAAIASLCVAGLGIGLGVTCTLVSLLAHAPQRSDHAVAAACSYLFRALGGTVCLALNATASNVVLRYRLAKALPRFGLDERVAEMVARQVRESLDAIYRIPHDLRVVVIECYADGSNAAFAVNVCFAFAAFIAACFIRNKGLEGK